MAAETQNKNDPIRIAARSDSGRLVVLHPENDDLFVSTGKQVIEACRLGISVDLWLHELRGMLESVVAWSDEHRARVLACYAAPRATQTALFFIPRSGHFDFDLADELVELNTRLLREFNVGAIEVLQVPGHELERFIKPDQARTLYGGQTEPHPAVATQS